MGVAVYYKGSLAGAPAQARRSWRFRRTEVWGLQLEVRAKVTQMFSQGLLCSALCVAYLLPSFFNLLWFCYFLFSMIF